MSRTDHGRARLFARWGLGLAGVATIAVVVAQLEASRPVAVPPEALQVDPASAEDAEPLTCVRRIASPDEANETPEPIEGPVGRVTSTELLECPDRFDGRTVIYVGEVIGDVLHRDGGAWVLMNDDAYALEVGPVPAADELRGYNSGVSVWLESPLPDLVDRPGDAGWRGDVLRVEGRVHRADPDDGGGLTIRATDAAVVAEAVRVQPPLHRAQAIAAAVFAAVASGVVVWERRAARAR